MLKVKIYGERNTNTNYLEKLINSNFHVDLLVGTVPPYIYKIQNFLPGNEYLRDLYFKYTADKNGGWKHSFPKLPKLVSEDPLVVTLTKNPYAWLISLYSKPYHQSKRYNSFETFLQSEWVSIKRENSPRYMFNNPIELWNHKNRAYLNLKEKCKLMTLTSEQLITNPSVVLEDISINYDLNYKNGTFVNYTKPAKQDNEKDNQYYKNYYMNELWHNKLSAESLKLINNHLDQSVMEVFNYKVLKPSDF